MLITKFNRMIRNKWLWTGFALLISVSFLGYFSPRSGGCGRKAFEEDQKAGAQGRLFDRNVPRNEFSNAQFFEMGLREQVLPPGGRERLHTRTWQRLVALQTADQLGIRTSPEEVAQVLTRDPSFSANGIFNKDQYKAIIQSQLGVNVALYETYLAQELTLQKLMGMLDSVLLTAPGEVQRRLSGLTDLFTVEYTVLTTNHVNTEVKVTPEDVETFYDNQKKRFTEPARMSVRYVSFPISNHIAGIIIPLSDMKDYYENYDEEFNANDTNDPAARLPFDQVTNTIAARLLQHEATKKAKNTATDFVMRLTDRQDSSITFEQAALSRGLAVSTTELFSITSKIPGIDIGADFTQAAFDLDPEDRARSVSDAVVGSNTVYVLAIQERIPERIPPLAEVRELAAALARRHAEETAFIAKCKDVRKTILGAVEGNKTFAEVVTGLGFNVRTTETFSVYSGFTNETQSIYADPIVMGVVYLAKGDVSEPLSASTNGVLILHVADRQPGDPATMLMIKPQIQSMIERSGVSVLFHDWKNYQLGVAGFEDYMPLRPETDDASKPEEEDSKPARPVEL